MNPGSERRTLVRTISEYWTVLAGLRRRALLTLLLTTLAGAFEGLAILTLVPLLEILISGDAQRVSGAWSNHLREFLQHWSFDDALIVVLCAFSAVGFTSALFRYASDRSMLRLRGSVEESMRKRMSDALFQTKWEHFVTLRLGDLGKSIIVEGFQVNMGVFALLEALGSTMVALLFLLLSCFISLKLTAFTLAFGLIGAVLYALLRRRSGRHSGKLSGMQRTMGEQVSDVFGALKLFRGGGQSEFARRKMHALFNEYAQAYFGTYVYGALMRFVLEFGAVLFVAGFLAFNHFVLHQSIASVFAFLSLFYRLAPRLLRIQEAFFDAESRISWYLTWKQRIDEAQKFREVHRGTTPPTFNHSLTFDSVSFSYPGREGKVLDAMNFTLRRGECVAVVGRSGGGKTTFLDLVLALISPKEGQIVLDGVPFNDLDMDRWRSAIGLVTQDHPLFYGTVAENVALGERNADPARVISALERAQAYSFVKDLPGDIRYQLQERGGNLSGGQKQRIALARALYREPALLILDEATSALDSESEEKVQQALRSLKGSLSMLIVAHRLSSLRFADRIIVLAEGRIIEEGSWEQLSRSNGAFAALLKEAAADNSGAI